MFDEDENKNQRKKNRDFSTPSMRMENNLANKNMIDNYMEPGIVGNEGFADTANVRKYSEKNRANNYSPNKMQQMNHPGHFSGAIYPNYANYPQYQMQHGYHQPAGVIPQPGMIPPHYYQPVYPVQNVQMQQNIPQNQMMMQHQNMGIPQSQVSFPQNQVGVLPGHMGTTQVQPPIQAQVHQNSSIQAAQNPIYIVYPNQPMQGKEPEIPQEIKTQRKVDKPEKKTNCEQKYWPKEKARTEIKVCSC